jgi:membrane-bound acyltransferase YfiQ involved in biofilm formation
MKKKISKVLLVFIFYSTFFGILYYFGTDKDFKKVLFTSLFFGFGMTIFDWFFTDKFRKIK